MSERLNSAHLISGLTEAGGGVFEFVKGLCTSMLRLNAPATVMGFQNGDEAVASMWHPCPVKQLPSMGPSFLQFPKHLSISLRETQVEVCHVHGLWSGFSQAAPRASARCNIPYVVSPHGMLEPWAWAYHAWKKRPIWWLWERNFLKRAAVLHATADSEVAGLRALGLRNPVAVIPPGVNLGLSNPTAHTASKGEKRVRVMLFLSRVHPKKGLLNLVEAWGRVRPKGWRVVVAGPDAGGHLGEVQAAVDREGMHEDFEFRPAVSGAPKWELLRSADVLVLPTMSENFGIVVIEALACGIPVITTQGAPWAELTAHQCGWWVGIGAGPLAAAVKDSTSLSDEDRSAMGARGRELVEEKYEWTRIVHSMLETYEWVIGRGHKPSCVRVD